MEADLSQPAGDDDVGGLDAGNLRLDARQYLGVFGAVSECTLHGFDHAPVGVGRHSQVARLRG
jgi:hypothetical protein